MDGPNIFDTTMKVLFRQSMIVSVIYFNYFFKRLKFKFTFLT